MHYLKKILPIALGLLMGTAVRLPAQLICNSSTDGSGLFTYSFTNDSSGAVWGLDPGDFIGIQSYGIEQIIAPATWTTAVDSVGYVKFFHTNGLYYIENTPLVFQIESHFTGSILYTNSATIAEFFQGAWVSASAYTKTTHLFLGTGYQAFDMLGPKPEPLFWTPSVPTNGARDLTISLGEMAGRTCIVQRASTPTGPDWVTITNFPIRSLTTNFVYTIPANTNSSFFTYRCEK